MCMHFKHTCIYSSTAHCAFSLELSQHYWSWCCISEAIAGSIAHADAAAAARIGVSLQMLTEHFGGVSLLPTARSIRGRKVPLAPDLPHHCITETGVVLHGSTSSASVPSGLQVPSSVSQQSTDNFNYLLVKLILTVCKNVCWKAAGNMFSNVLLQI